MIRYPILEEELRARIEAAVPGWAKRARERTDELRRIGRYEEASGIWSEVKKVYIEIQHRKCAYCERLLPDPRYGAGKHDVEHFRPKSRVEAWPTPKMARERKIAYDFPTGDELPEGYFLLAYHPLNYAMACRTCNSPLKASFFPIAGPRVPACDDPRDLAAEQPFLLYPLGDLDDDPEDLLTFDGVTCVPREVDGLASRRARVTIDFFALNDQENLWRDRAETLLAVYWALRVPEISLATHDRDLAARVLRTRLSPNSAHTNCARAFHTLFTTDRRKANALAERAQEYLDSQS